MITRHPMTYVTIRRQYLVITNGGHNCLGTTRGDAIIAPARKLKRVAAKLAGIPTGKIAGLTDQERQLLERDT